MFDAMFIWFNGFGYQNLFESGSLQKETSNYLQFH